MFGHYETHYVQLISGIRSFFASAGKSRAVLGLSGGIDSALVLCLAADALGKENVHGLMMPSPFSTVHSVTDAVKLAEQVGISYHILPIDSIYNKFIKELAPAFGGLPIDTTEENIQARIRGTLLMAYANKKDCLLLNTTNKSELAMGYGTLYGDLAGALMVLADLYKTEAYALSHYINAQEHRIPEAILSKAPSAELRPDQKDSDSLPPYDILDPLLYALIEKGQDAETLLKNGAPPDILQHIIQAKARSAFKVLQLPPLIRVSSAPLLPPEKWI
jgi:NAD+ synthetase